jgi:hypothetical protein
MFVLAFPFMRVNILLCGAHALCSLKYELGLRGEPEVERCSAYVRFFEAISVAGNAKTAQKKPFQ